MSKLDRGLVLITQGVQVDPVPPPPPPPGNYMLVLVTFDGTIDPLKAFGFIPGIVVGSMATGVIKADYVSDLASLPNVIRVDRDRTVRLNLTQSVPDIQADKVQKPPQGSGILGYDGSGVIIGVIDIGFDYRHSAFRKPDGSTRILKMWDQFGDWQPGLNYGEKYTSAQINASLAYLANPNTGKWLDYCQPNHHGTHVLGIAAGSGSPGPNNTRHHVGVAPGADIIVVDHRGHGEVSVAEAIQFIALEALAQDKRAVINMSLGFTGWACDGYAPGDRVLNALAAEHPHIVLVASAGNAGGFDFHCQGNVSENSPFICTLVSNGRTCVIYFWYSAADQLMLTVTPPPDSGLTGPLGFDPSTEDTEVFEPEGENRISFAAEVHPYNGKRRLLVAISPGERAEVALGNWTFGLAGIPAASGAVHAWIDVDISGRTALRPKFLAATPACTEESPGAGEKVISVGSYLTTNAEAGKKQYPVGSLSFFSSRGPLLSPGFTPAARLKPDISAPGHFISSANNMLSEKPQEAVIDDYVAKVGTSMAAPHVAGVVALLLQKEPTLTQQQVLERLTQNARRDAFTGPNPNPDWGHGKLDAWATLYPANQGNVVNLSIVPEQLKAPLGGVADAMSRSALGRNYLSLFRAHVGEIADLIRSHRKVGAAWLRHGAPAVHALLTALRTPDDPLPGELYGRSLRERLGRFLSVLARYGSPELRAAARSAGNPLPGDGMSWNEIKAGFSGGF